MCTDFDTKKNSLVFYTMNDLKPGDEIFNYYGDRKNADFFLNNGFVYQNHPRDTIRVKIGLSPSDPLFSQKEVLCKKINLQTSNTFELTHRSDQMNKRLLAFVRIFLFNKGKIRIKMFCEFGCSRISYFILQINLRNGLLLNILKICLKKIAMI